MKRILFFISVLFLFSMNRLSAQQWELVWSDEFSTDQIDATNWVFETGAGGWGNNELQNYTNREDNVSCSDGNLMIIANKESYQGSNYTSARMKTYGKHSWTYGKVEARMKMPTEKGVWPAFWMLGNSINTESWPKCGEIDIMEHINTDNTIYGTMHWDNNGHASYGGSVKINDVTQFHTYSIEWDSTAIKWFVDDKQFWIGSIAKNINSTNEFHKPFFILLNMAVGGNWPGNPDGTTVFPDTLYVDYVKVYQKKATTSINSTANPENEFHIYPNPVTEASSLIIKSKNNEDFQLEIRDLLGKIYVQKNISSRGNETNSIPLSVNDLQSGIYFLTIRGDRKQTCLKLIKL
jgi:beta-glucanase (GH16 family)